MKIVICGSMSAHKEMSEAKEKLEASGHIVEMPGLDNLKHELDQNGDTLETSKMKIEQDLIRVWFQEIKNSDAVLVVNTDKKGITGYVGGNTFLELSFAHVLHKKVFILDQYSREIPYHDEIDAMQPVILHGDLSRLK